MEIPVDPNITQAELLQELSSMTLSEILSVPLTGRFNGMFETFEEMGSCPVPAFLLRKMIPEPTYQGKREYHPISVGNYKFPFEESHLTAAEEGNLISEVMTCRSENKVHTGSIESNLPDADSELELSLLKRGTLWITQQEMNQPTRAEARKAA